MNNNTLTTNQRKSTCKHCGNTLPAGYGVKIHTANAFGYMCPDCARKYDGGYHTENDEIVNQTTKTNDCTISIELEIPRLALNYNDEKAFGWLKQYNFINTDDCTVWREWKSPIFNNLLGLSKILHNLEKMNHLNQWNTDSTYGTHCNIGNTKINANTINIIRRFYHSLVLEYSNYLTNNPQKCRELYGRELGGWASGINESTNPDEHRNFFNIQHNTHIEFRVAKLVTAKQYLMACRLNQDIVQKVIVDFFLAKYDEGMTAQQKRELAQKASQKMVKLFEKYHTKLTANQ